MSQHSSEQTSGRDSHGRAPSDLRSDEAGVAGWFRLLKRHETPVGVRREALAAEAFGGATAAGRPSGRLLQLFPLGGWGLATAALLLLALGTATAVELSDGPQAAPTVAPSSGLVETAGAHVQIVEDPSMALFHDVETFDDLGLARGEVIAEWGR